MQQTKIVCRCIDKKRDSSGNVTDFLLVDSNGKKKVFAKDVLKLAMTNGEVEVINLQIDGGGRLVDKAIPNKKHSEHLESPSAPTRQIQDMTNKELFEYMKGIDDAEKLSNEQLLRIIKEIYKRCVHTDNEFNQLTSTTIPTMVAQIQQLQDTIQNQETPSLQSQMENIQSYLEQNADRLNELKSNIENLTSHLSNMTEHTNSVDDAEEPHLIIPTDGKFIYPDDEVSKFFYQQVFMEDSSGAINITNETLLNALKSEIADVYAAYKYTEDFYISQFEEHSALCKDSVAFAEIIGFIGGNIGDKLREAASIPDIELSDEAKKDIKLSFLGSLEKIFSAHRSEKIRRKRIKDEYGENKQVNKGKAKRLMNGKDALWNCGLEFICDTEQWEVMLFVIQMLNKLYMDTFEVSGSINGEKLAREGVCYNDVVNEDGKFRPTIAHQISLKEVPLTEVCNKVIYLYAMSDKQSLRDKEVYDRIVVAHFASKRVLYRASKYPFSNKANEEINGLHVKLMEQALTLMNLHPDTTLSQLNVFICNNNDRKDYKYHIKTDVDLSTLSI